MTNRKIAEQALGVIERMLSGTITPFRAGVRLRQLREELEK